MAGVALGDMDLHFAWQVWHLRHWVTRLVGIDAGDAASLCVAGVALGDMDYHFVWQAGTW